MWQDGNMHKVHCCILNYGTCPKEKHLCNWAVGRTRCFFHATPFSMKEWLKKLWLLIIRFLKNIFSKKEEFLRTHWQYWLSMINFEFLSVPNRLIASWDFSDEMGDDFNKCHFYFYNEMYPHLQDLHSSVKPYFPKDLCTL